jgi:hypothetical protein
MIVDGVGLEVTIGSVIRSSLLSDEGLGSGGGRGAFTRLAPLSGLAPRRIVGFLMDRDNDAPEMDAFCAFFEDHVNGFRPRYGSNVVRALTPPKGQWIVIRRGTLKNESDSGPRRASRGATAVIERNPW